MKPLRHLLDEGALGHVASDYRRGFCDLSRYPMVLAFDWVKLIDGRNANPCKRGALGK